ncbi:hypothetical protein A2957_02765 [Candidatus Roizmanbacteria bacterium RIFCSPLOWO2_01_FULL_38_11]|uniref:Sortase n=1 Tax=Candidatus Roizmanbacteria bacterium RIFCSPLOWO2_01_FULL_38_11 TaxID=1802060 RepID=A0A1F7IKU3_9BACT|nr:MAG: hypothetical protein A2957_02765 [Candidatus Roizmanbacteria bacterium RIFCSPLOWO2_01_FULL_38_11]
MAQKISAQKKVTLNKLSNFSIVLGSSFCALALVLVVQRYSPLRLSFNINFIPQSVSTSQKIEIRPVRIVISSQKINLPIIDARISKKKWPTSESGVSYIKDSSIPGEKGNSILYGHNWTTLLGNLIYVKPGEKIEVYFSDQSKKTFVVENTATVSPKNITVLLSSKEPLLTIYTCTGFLDSKRFVVTARPLNS